MSWSSDDALERIAHQKELRGRFYELLPSIADADGLVPTSATRSVSVGKWSMKQDPEIAVVAHWRSEAVAAFVEPRSDLWNLASLRVQPGRSIVGRLKAYGFPFSLAVQDALSHKLSASRYYALPESLPPGAHGADLLVQLNRRKESNGTGLVLEAWEMLGGNEVSYVHMILSQNGRFVQHMDGAVIEFASEPEARLIFRHGRKRKGSAYTKYFRLDGDIQIEDAIAIAQHYFQAKELVAEYFEVELVEPVN